MLIRHLRLLHVKHLLLRLLGQHVLSCRRSRVDKVRVIAHTERRGKRRGLKLGGVEPTNT